jgi:hypothetical protein
MGFDAIFPWGGEATGGVTLKDILLSNPLVLLYSLYVAALLVVSLWPRRSTPPPAESQKPPLRFERDSRGHGERALQDLEASCVSEYSSRFSGAIKRIRNEEALPPGGGPGIRII